MLINKMFNPSCSEMAFSISEEKTGTVAIAMLEIINRNWKENTVDHKTHPKYKAAVKLLKANPDFDKNIAIPWSCNYVTYIWKDGEDIKINTCNNEDWDSLELDVTPHSEERFNLDENTTFLDLKDLTEKTVKEIEKEQYQ